VRFDDRLLTVLNQPAEDRHDAAVRWRQLVDLVARAGANSASPVTADALAAICEEGPRVEEAVRAATARAVAALPLPLGLLEYFASDSLSVAAPVLAAATLDARQWRALLAVADEEAQAFIAALHPDLRAEAPAEKLERHVRDLVPEMAEAHPEPVAGGSPSLQDVIERIERRRRLRSGQAAVSTETASPSPGSSALFRWECGPGGEIAWVEGAPRGPLIGRSIARQEENDGDRVDPEVVRAFSVRAPFRDAVLRVGGAGPVAGEWKISGVPAFEPADGRFAGYRGSLCATLLRHLQRRLAKRFRTCCRTRIRSVSWSTRSRLRSTPSWVSRRSSKGSIWVLRTEAIASALPRSDVRRACF